MVTVILWFKYYLVITNQASFEWMKLNVCIQAINKLILQRNNNLKIKFRQITFFSFSINFDYHRQGVG